MSMKHFSFIVGLIFCTMNVLQAMEEGTQPEKKARIVAASAQQSKLLKELVATILAVPSLREYAVLKVSDYVAQGKITPEQLENLPENFAPVIRELSKVRKLAMVKKDEQSIANESDFLRGLINHIAKLIQHVPASQEEFENTKMLLTGFKNYIPTSLANAFQLLLGRAWIDRDFAISLIDFKEDRLTSGDLRLVKQAIKDYRNETEQLMILTHSGIVPYDEFILQEPNQNVRILLKQYQKKYTSYSQIIPDVSKILSWFNALVSINDPLLSDQIIQQFKPDIFSRLISTDQVYDVILGLAHAFTRLQNMSTFFQHTESELIKFFIIDFINAYDMAIRFSPQKESMQGYLINDKSVVEIFSELPKMQPIVESYKHNALLDAQFINDIEDKVNELELFGHEVEE